MISTLHNQEEIKSLLVAMISFEISETRFCIKCDKMAASGRGLLSQRKVLFVIKDTLSKQTPKFANVSFISEFLLFPMTFVQFFNHSIVNCIAFYLRHVSV